MVDLSKIDEEIRRVQADSAAEIRKLEALKLVASDPKLVDMLVGMAAKNDGQKATIVETGQQAAAEAPNKGSLIRTAKLVCATFAGQFTAHDVIEQMKARGFNFAAKNPHIAINGILRKLVKRGLVRLADKGTGRIANRYEFVR